jgi:hypothetical protein
LHGEWAGEAGDDISPGEPGGRQNVPVILIWQLKLVLEPLPGIHACFWKRPIHGPQARVDPGWGKIWMQTHHSQADFLQHTVRPSRLEYSCFGNSQDGVRQCSRDQDIGVEEGNEHY